MTTTRTIHLLTFDSAKCEVSHYTIGESTMETTRVSALNMPSVYYRHMPNAGHEHDRASVHINYSDVEIRDINGQALLRFKMGHRIIDLHLSITVDELLRAAGECVADMLADQ